MPTERVFWFRPCAYTPKKKGKLNLKPLDELEEDVVLDDELDDDELEEDEELDEDELCDGAATDEEPVSDGWLGALGAVVVPGVRLVPSEPDSL
jgi:hypothetical protein